MTTGPSRPGWEAGPDAHARADFPAGCGLTASLLVRAGRVQIVGQVVGLNPHQAIHLVGLLEQAAEIAAEQEMIS